MSTGAEVIVTMEMVKAFLVEWLIRYGTEWTDHHYVMYHSPTKAVCIEKGYITRRGTTEPTDNMFYGWVYQLTDKALELLKEDDRE